MTEENKWGSRKFVGFLFISVGAFACLLAGKLESMHGAALLIANSIFYLGGQSAIDAIVAVVKAKLGK